MSSRRGLVEAETPSPSRSHGHHDAEINTSDDLQVIRSTSTSFESRRSAILEMGRNLLDRLGSERNNNNNQNNNINNANQVKDNLLDFVRDASFSSDSRADEFYSIWRDGTHEYQNRMLRGSFSNVGNNPSSSSYSFNYDEPRMPSGTSRSFSSLSGTSRSFSSLSSSAGGGLLEDPPLGYSFGDNYDPLAPPSVAGPGSQSSEELLNEEEEKSLNAQQSHSFAESVASMYQTGFLASLSGVGAGSTDSLHKVNTQTSELSLVPTTSTGGDISIPLMESHGSSKDGDDSSSPTKMSRSSFRSVDNNITSVHYYDDPDLAKSNSNVSNNKVLAISTTKSSTKGEIELDDTKLKEIATTPTFMSSDNEKVGGEEDAICNQYSFARQSVLSPKAALSIAKEPPVKSNKSSSSVCNWRKHWLTMSVVFIFVVHGIFALGVFLSKLHSDVSSSSNALSENDNVFGTLVPTPSPPLKSSPPMSQQNPTRPPTKAGVIATTPTTTADVIAPAPTTRNVRLETIQNRIHKAIPGDKVLDESSIQYSVVKWLAFDDPYQLPLLGTPLSVLVERFVSVLLFYATGGNQWVDSNQFMTNSSVCEWNAGVANSGIYCDEFGSIEMIIIYDNDLRGQLPSELQVVSALRVLSLFSNQLTGTIPWELASLRLLHTLDLESNRFTGELPQSIFTLPLLKSLNLSFNKDLTGSLPQKTFLQARSLERLNLVNCDLTGTIPNQIGRVESLQVMSLGLNRLNGTLPSELSRLHEMSVLDLSCNQLSGTIPEGISKLRKIDRLWLHGNNFSGELKNSFCDIPELLVDCAVDSFSDSATVQCDCCDGCMTGEESCPVYT